MLVRLIVGRVPVVVTAHEIEPAMVSLLTAANAVIATTVEHARRIREADSAAAQRLSVIAIGPNVEPAADGASSLTARARHRWGIPTGAPLVVFFGFLHPVQGREYLIRAMARVVEHCPEARLVIAGGWRSLALPGAEGDGYRDRLQALIGECCLDRRVHITGYLSEHDVSALLFAADVVALPFTYGLSFKSGSLLAALAHGKPVVGTLPGVADPRLIAGQHMLAVRARDADALAAAIRSLLDDEQLPQRIARARGMRAARPFTWGAIADQHLDLYSRHATISHRVQQLRSRWTAFGSAGAGSGAAPSRTGYARGTSRRS